VDGGFRWPGSMAGAAEQDGRSGLMTELDGWDESDWQSRRMIGTHHRGCGVRRPRVRRLEDWESWVWGSRGRRSRARRPRVRGSWVWRPRVRGSWVQRSRMRGSWVQRSRGRGSWVWGPEQGDLDVGVAREGPGAGGLGCGGSGSGGWRHGGLGSGGSGSELWGL
jgi:hypothetical protein